MSATQELRQIDYYDYYASKLEEFNRYVRQHAAKGHGRRKLKEQGRRMYRSGSRPKGIHDYNNMQWDPSIFRGRTFRDFREKNASPYDSVVNVNNYCCFGCNTVSSNRRKTVVGIPRLKVGGVFRPSTDDIMFEESSGRKRHKQDESQKEMEPFITEQMVPPEYVESGVQGDEIKEIPKKKCFPVAIGRSAGTQADICIIGTGSHEDPIEPIFAEVGSKVLEQSLLETFEEYELHTIDSEIRALMETRRTRQARNMKLVEQQLYKAEQKEMERIRREKELQQELEATENITATFYSINICTLIMARTLDKMRRHKFLRAEGHDAELLKEWAHKEMYRRLKIPRMIVDDIIQNAENGRLDAFNLLGGVFDNLSPEDGDFERKISQSEEEGNEESVGPPPNTASSLPYTTSEEEDNNDAFL